MTRLALIGYGRIAPKHLDAFRAQGAEFVACCNRSEAGRESARTDGRIDHVYASIGEMLEREQPDGIICCASIHQVYGAAREIIPSGIPVLLEKPPGTSIDEYEQLCSLAERHKTPVMVGLNRRHYSVVRRAVDDAGGLESITTAAAEWSEDPQHFLKRGFSAQQVSRMVFGNTLHGIDLLTFFAGGCERPQITAVSRGEPLRWTMALQGMSERNVLATFNSTWDAPGRWRVAFCTAGRRYTFAPLETCEVMTSGTRDVRSIEPDEHDKQFKPGFYRQAQVFLEMVASRQAPAEHDLISAGPAMRLAQQLTDACLQSAAESGATA